MQQDLGAGECADLVHTADVIGMAMGADDAGDVLERSADPREIRAEGPRGAGMSGVDERDLVPVHEQIRLRADEPNDMHVW